MGNFYKLNKTYIDSFRNNVYRRFGEKDKRLETGLLKSVLDEVIELFRKIGGKTSSKRDIPEADEYPDTVKYNRLLNNIALDLDKLYNAQRLVEGDVNNLLNFNSNQRDKTFENFTTAQQEVYSAYVKARKDVVGGVTVPASNPFTSSDNMSPESKDVYIDETRKALTLGFSTTVNKPVDIRNVVVYFSGRKPTQPIYPNSDTLAIGSHWKKSATDPHFIDSSNLSQVDSYRTRLIDDPNNNEGIGICEFEAVETTNFQIFTGTRAVSSFRLCGYSPVVYPIFEDYAVTNLKKFIGEIYGKDSELIYLDVPNSLQGSDGYFKLKLQTAQGSQKPRYKLVVPFVDAGLTNEIAVELTPNADGFIPKINWMESKVFSNVGGSDLAYALIEPKTVEGDMSVDGKYICHIARFVIPSRMELIIEYDSDELMWLPTPFYMAHYVYSDQKTYELPYLNDNQDKVYITLKKSYDIFVDAEASEEREKRRALNVLRTPNRGNR